MAQALIRPTILLRLPDKPSKIREYNALVIDLRRLN
jgi:hypothetical protein